MGTAVARKAYRERHPERDRQARREAKARWIAKNPEKYAEANRRRTAAYREKFPERAKAAMRNWYHNNKVVAREHRLKRIFGLTVVQWEAKFEAQGRACGCCGSLSPNSKKGWQTDHCHTTGKLRDILCAPCNLLLTEHMERVIEKMLAYLGKHRGG